MLTCNVWMLGIVLATTATVPILRVVDAVAKSESSLSHTKPPPPPCSLNGDLHSVTGVCICDKPWTGPNCAVFKFHPVSLPQGYGMLPNKTTWGGDIVIIDDDNNQQFHLFVTAMTNNSTLRKWTEVSRVEHAVADTITGPYKFVDVAVPVWAHNPKVIRLPNGTLALIHIGTGTTCQSIDDAGMKRSSQRRQLAEKDSEYSPFHFSSQTIQSADNLFMEAGERHIPLGEDQHGSTIHLAPSVNGPWTPLLNHTLGHCNNPAPFVHHNVDDDIMIYIVCSAGNVSHLMRAQDIAGPWTTLSQVTPFPEDEELPDDHTASTGIDTNRWTAGGKQPHYEDPSLYIDHRGFHIIYHLYDTAENPPHGHDCTHSTVSAHVYSPDGQHWYKSPGQPYGTQIELVDGRAITVSTRERPSLVFRNLPSGGRLQLTHLVTGVCSVANCPDGPPTGCVDCKYDHWDYTLVQALDVS